ncbi:MAG: GNAT family N-acetyltransferase [Defluviitaleaceae bacterium]|nr:GNAT family N-acetyltransferase [Defluviitaleaceae bacterium]
MLEIGKATQHDAEALMHLYHNHLTSQPPTEEQNIVIWRDKIARFEQNPMYYLLVGKHDGFVVSSVTLVVVENLTRNNRPYAIIENVVTHADYRGKGYASALMRRASAIAEKMGCYKIMLLTGSKEESTLGFYDNCGFDRTVKTGYARYFSGLAKNI